MVYFLAIILTTILLFVDSQSIKTGIVQMYSLIYTTKKITHCKCYKKYKEICTQYDKSSIKIIQGHRLSLQFWYKCQELIKLTSGNLDNHLQNVFFFTGNRCGAFTILGRGFNNCPCTKQNFECETERCACKKNFLCNSICHFILSCYYN